MIQASNMKKRQYRTEAGLPTYDGSKRARIDQEYRIQKAVNAFKNDRMSLTKAAAQFTVPFLTLQTRVATEELSDENIYIYIRGNNNILICLIILT
jgi:predicted HTH domain antitoxin